MEDILVTSEDLWRDISVWTASLYGFLTLMSLFRSSLLVDDRPLVGEVSFVTDTEGGGAGRSTMS